MIGVILREYGNTVIHTTHLGRLRLDRPLGGEIGLVADEQLVDILARVAVNLLQPLLDVVERLLIGDIVDDNDAVRAAIVRRCDRAESLLAGRVPLKIL